MVERSPSGVPERTGELRLEDGRALAWSEWGPCSDQGECAPDAVRACENEGSQVCGGNCSYGNGSSNKQSKSYTPVVLLTKLIGAILLISAFKQQVK